MKSIPVCLLVLMACACNNNKSETTISDSSVAAGKQTAGAAGRCAGLYIFRKGTVVENISYDADGKQTSKQVSKVLDVTEQDGKLTSSMEMKSTGDGSEQTVTGKYSCDGNNLYVDLGSLFSSMDTKGAKVEGDAISFPINLTEGQTLPEASYSFSMETEGKPMKMTATLKDRKVEGKEIVTTPAGTFNSYKITSTIESSMDIPGIDEKTKQMMEAMRKNMPKQKLVMYFDPSVSIVKVEVFSGEKMVSRSEVSSIKNQ